MTMATDLGYGSEGLCPHCRWYNSCSGSTKPPKGFMVSASRQDCYGADTYAPACSTGDSALDWEYGIKAFTIEFGHKFEEDKG